MKRKKMKGLASLKETRQKAHATSSYFPIPIYLETDGSHSVKFPNDRKAVLYVTADRSDAEYHIGRVHNVYTGRMKPGYVRV